MVNVSGAGHVAAGAGTVVVVARCAVLGIEAVTAWIVHEVALADVDASGVERVLVIVAAVVVVVVGGAGLLLLLLSAARAVRAMLMAASGLRASALAFSMMSAPSVSSRTGLPLMLLSGFLWTLQ